MSNDTDGASSANWMQMASDRQLDVDENQGVVASLQSCPPASGSNLPTGVTGCFSLNNQPIPDGGEVHPFQGERKAIPLPRSESLFLAPRPAPRLDVTILSLDLGTRTGWALHQPDGSITSGTVSFVPQRFEGGGMRYLRFKRWLTELKQTTDGIDAVYFEEVRRHAGVDAAHAYGGFMAHLTAWCEHHQIPYQGVPVGTIKKHATGKGNAGKAEMISAMRAKGFQPTDDNEADALALLCLAMAQGGLA